LGNHCATKKKLPIAPVRATVRGTCAVHATSICTVEPGATGPSSAPDIAESLRLVLGWAWTYVIVAELIGAIKVFSHMDRTQDKERVDVRANLENTLKLFTHRIREKKIVLDRSYAPDVPQVVAYPGELNQVWANLVSNAIDAVDIGGQIGLHLRQGGEWLVVEVRDNGSGIPPEIRMPVYRSQDFA